MFTSAMKIMIFASSSITESHKYSARAVEEGCRETLGPQWSAQYSVSSWGNHSCRIWSLFKWSCFKERNNERRKQTILNWHILAKAYSRMKTEIWSQILWYGKIHCVLKACVFLQVLIILEQNEALSVAFQYSKINWYKALLR